MLIEPVRRTCRSCVVVHPDLEFRPSLLREGATLRMGCVKMDLYVGDGVGAALWAGTVLIQAMMEFMLVRELSAMVEQAITNEPDSSCGGRGVTRSVAVLWSLEARGWDY